MVQYRCCEEKKDEICPSLDLIRVRLESFKLSRSEPVKAEFMISINAAYNCACKKRSPECMGGIKRFLIEFHEGGKIKKARTNDDQPNLFDK